MAHHWKKQQSMQWGGAEVFSQIAGRELVLLPCQAEETPLVIERCAPDTHMEFCCENSGD